MFQDICLTDYSLRNYQQEAKEKIFGQWDFVDNVLYQMPTGTGKTRLFTSIIRDISLNSLKTHRREGILIIAHRTELIEQIDESLQRYHIPHGIIAGSFKDKRDLMLPVQVASVQTITHPSNRQLANSFDAKFIIIDEAHHAIASSYTRLWDIYPSAKKLGVTATPWRMDGRGFRNNFDVLVPSMPIKDFMEQGWLAPYQYYSVPINSSLCKDINSIRDFGIDGDYKTSVLEELIDTSRIRAQLLDSYYRFVEGKKGIIYSISRLHSKHICQQYRAAGIKIADIDSETPPVLRKRLVQDFKNGDLDIIVNVDIFSEGFDCPDLEFVQLARPTRSLVKYIQQVGRGLRKNGDKQCLILDNVGMYGRFGLPDDDRPWEEYFIGNPQAESNWSSHESNSSNVNSRNFRETDLSEGVEEMTLIQSVSTSFMTENNEVSQNQLGTSIEEPIVTNEIMSTVVFAKYKIYENADGYGIYNIKTGERQFLSGSQSRQSISIKLLKTSDHPKKYTLVSSSNRDSHVSPNDRVIGFLFKDGRALRFESQKIDSVINIKI